MLEEADADFLLLLDCCHAAALPTTDCHQRTGGVVEVIAACGYENVAAEVDQHSFTKALTETLAIVSKARPFSIGELHSRVLSRLKCCAPQLALDREGNYIKNTEGLLLYERQPRKTPIYSILCETFPRRSIVLGLLLDSLSSSSSDCDQEDSDSSPTTSPELSDSDGESKRTFQSCRLEAGQPGSQFPQVLLAIRLDDDKFDLAAWVEWVRNAPLEAKDIHIQSTYGSFSTLVLIRMPIPVWNMLPENPAYSFVGFVTSGNNLTETEQGQPLCVCVQNKHSVFRKTTKVQETSQRSNYVFTTAIKVAEETIQRNNSAGHIASDVYIASNELRSSDAIFNLITLLVSKHSPILS